MKIDRCICTGRDFAGLCVQGQRHGWSLGETMRRTEAGRCCTMCAPYVRRAWRTGITVFTETLQDADEPPLTADERVGG